VAKDAVAKDAMVKDAVAKDAMVKDVMVKDAVMTDPVARDPLDALRLPVVPVDPRPAFAASLLRRIEGRQAAAEPHGATVRYFVRDLDAAVDFYCRLLGFEEELRPSPAFAMLYRGNLRLLLSVPGGPGAGGALPGGTLPEPGGWNRMALGVTDLAAAVRRLRRQGARLRTVPAAVTVSQVLVEDPDGNLVELFEPGPGYHERAPGPADTGPADTGPPDTGPPDTDTAPDT
jgi:catechol 2,3-dioxygenase-like lactoylglutathione lyase family enzyme